MGSMKQAAKKLAKAKKDALVRKNALLKGLHAAEKGFERSETKKALLVDKKNIKKKVKSKTTQPTIKRKQLKKIEMGVELRKGKKRLVIMKKYSRQAKINGKT